MAIIKIGPCGHKTVYLSNAFFKNMGAVFKLKTPSEIPVGFKQVCTKCKPYVLKAEELALVAREPLLLNYRFGYLKYISPNYIASAETTVTVEYLVESHFNGTLESKLSEVQNKTEVLGLVKLYLEEATRLFLRLHHKRNGFLVSKRLYLK